MQVLEQFEYPLPRIKTDIEKIVIETSIDYEGSFMIRNEGSGNLSGTIASNSKSIRFSPKEISSNKVNVFYALDLDIYKPGDMLRTEIVISSNGGEMIIPVIIKVTNEAIITRDGEKISSIKDFSQYVKKNPTEARQLLISNEFTMWLSAIGYEHMEILDHLISDTNRERAVDNFLILSKMKKRARVRVDQKSIDITRSKNENTIIAGSIHLTRVGWGYIEGILKTKNNSDWLTLSTDKITSSLFKNADTAEIPFEVDTSKIKEGFVREDILMVTDAEQSVTVHVKCERQLRVSLSKTFFANEDAGAIEIENKSGTGLMVGVSTLDKYVKFDAKSYMIGEKATIPFHIKISALQSAQLAIKKQPIITAEIILQTIVGEAIFKKRLKIYIGNLLNKTRF